MSNAKIPWYVAERSEALAGWLLTARNDVRVRSKQERDDGVDLLVEVNTGEALATRLFAVQVRGATSLAPSEWAERTRHLFGAGPIYLPACVFVMNVRDTGALYAWVAEPQVEPNGAALRFHENGDFRDLNPAAIDSIVERVKAWYDAVPRQLVPA